jgi:hypothetical protein
MLPHFNENVALVLHYNQALLDIIDDLEDIEEDVKEGLPNMFVMTALSNVSYHVIRNSSKAVRKKVLNGIDASDNPTTRLVNDLQRGAKTVTVPESFAFLKSLSDYYAELAKSKISLECVYQTEN